MKRERGTGNGAETFETLILNSRPEIQLRSGESSHQLHERLRPQVMGSFRHLDGPTKIITPSEYTFDLSKIGIEGGVALVHPHANMRPLFVFLLEFED